MLCVHLLCKEWSEQPLLLTLRVLCKVMCLCLCVMWSTRSKDSTVEAMHSAAAREGVGPPPKGHCDKPHFEGDWPHQAAMSCLAQLLPPTFLLSCFLQGATEDMVARIFRSFPGMDYCDLKRDRVTGQSKGYAYVNYSTADAAAAAVEQLNGLEFPPHSGQRLKVRRWPLPCVA